MHRPISKMDVPFALLLIENAMVFSQTTNYFRSV